MVVRHEERTIARDTLPACVAQTIPELLDRGAGIVDQTPAAAKHPIP
jgi:hypothetical protein